MYVLFCRERGQKGEEYELLLLNLILTNRVRSQRCDDSIRTVQFLYLFPMCITWQCHFAWWRFLIKPLGLGLSQSQTDPFSWDQRPIFRILLLTKLSFIFYLSILFLPSLFATLIFFSSFLFFVVVFFAPGLLSVFSTLPSPFSIYSTTHDSNLFEIF